MFDIKRFLAALLALLMLAGCLAESDAFRSVYTYNYDYWEDIRESPDAYKVKTVLYSTTLELGTNASLGAQNVPMSKPQSLFVKEDKLYVCDTGNNRILEITQLPDAQPEQISNETPPADALPDEVPSETDASSEAQASAGTQGADVSITYDTQSGYRVRIIYGFTVDSKRIDPAYKAVVEARIAQEKAEQAAGLDDDTPQYDENGVEIEDEFEDVNSFDEFLKSVSCSFSGPSDISVDDLGRLYIADKRELPPSLFAP